MAAGVDEKIRFAKFWLKGSNFEPIVRSCDFHVSERPTNDTKTRFFEKKVSFIDLVRVKLSCCTTHTFWPNRWIVTSFWKMSFSKEAKDDQQKDQNWDKQKIKTWSSFFSNETRTFFLDYSPQRQVYRDWNYLPDQSFGSYIYYFCHESGTKHGINL